jgi:hypothetical protein
MTIHSCKINSPFRILKFVFRIKKPLKVLKWTREASLGEPGKATLRENGCHWDTNTFARAALSGHLDILK